MKKRLFTFLLITTVICCFVATYHVYVPASNSKTSTIVDIPKGSSVRSISSLLYKSGLTRNPWAFYYYVRYKKQGQLLKAGAFKIPPNLNLNKTLTLLITQNGVANLVRVVIPEGYSVNDIAHRLEKLGLTDYEEFSNYVHKSAKKDLIKDVPFLNDIPVKTLEGYLFPDTYFFEKNITKKRIVITMLREFERKILPLWAAQPKVEGSPKSRFNIHQVSTIASIIEKEARRVAEMPIISSVFYNRLKKKMLLGSDPTVVYAMGKRYKERVLYRDTRVDSPYNTYKYTGFPPSPISSFGVAAFKASLNPAKTNHYFFFAKKDGTHTFTPTYKEHLRLQRKR
ncbi:endolytic transglycosylase MltG [Candidatus Marinamargulisbacteria bacterium SCGC AAA071-K20]|nr:endolytic transglycosylase MltG [Candidatus Marinamargulisbacteria bacterium SCGC AAA071-K20]